jgi:hypothetical protein
MSWADLEKITAPPPEDDGAERRREAARSYLRTFTTNDGDAVLAELRKLFLDKEAPPECSDAALRHLEGQRSVVRFILRKIDEGSK